MKYISIIILSVLIFSISCEDPIDVDLNDSEPTLVVDAWLDNMERTQIIRLSQSLPYFDNVTPPAITDANVTIQSDIECTLPAFTHRGNGEYVFTPTNGGIFDACDASEYILRIEWNGTVYSATTGIHRVPEIDSISVEFRENEPFNDDGFYAQFIARDPAGFGDTYWIKSYKNDTLLSKPIELNIAYDAGFDSGSRVDGVVFIFPIREFTNPLDENGAPSPYVTGDKVYVEIHSISNEAFQFLDIARDQLNNSQNGIFALPITNTRTNIVNEGGGASPLGYFNIARVSSAERIIGE